MASIRATHRQAAVVVAQAPLEPQTEVRRRLQQLWEGRAHDTVRGDPVTTLLAVVPSRPTVRHNIRSEELPIQIIETYFSGILISFKLIKSTIE